MKLVTVRLDPQTFDPTYVVYKPRWVEWVDRQTDIVDGVRMAGATALFVPLAVFVLACMLAGDLFRLDSDYYIKRIPSPEWLEQLGDWMLANVPLPECRK